MTKQETTTWELLRAIRGVDDTQGNQFSITVTKEKRILDHGGHFYTEDDYRIRSSATVPAKRHIISRDYYVDPDGIIISKYWGGCFKTYPISTTTILEAVGHGYIINGTFADNSKEAENGNS